MKKIFLAPLLSATLLMPSPVWAVNRDMVQLQTQVQALQDSLARLQQSNDERMGVLRDLVQQTADNVNRMSQSVDALSRKLAAQSDASAQKEDQVSGQVQSLNDSIDELKARLGRIEKSLGDIQNSQQSVNARLDSSAPSAGATTTTTPAPASPSDFQPTPGSTRGGRNQAPAPVVQEPPASAPPAASSAPPVRDIYQTAYGDFNAAKYPLAGQEFADVVKYYPDDPLAGNAYFYLGEIEYKQGHFAQAVKNYDRVLEQYPGNPKTPTSQLRKGQALLSLKQNDAGVRELRSLVQRFPNSPEAVTARGRLNALGVGANSRR